MAKNEFVFELPQEFIPLLSKMTGDTIEKKVKISLAINLFVNKTVTLEKASELSGESLIGFIGILNDQEISWLEYTEDHKQQDDKVIRQILNETEHKYE